MHLQTNKKGGLHMELVQPIRDKRQLDSMQRELLKSGSRDYMLFFLGIHIGLRISDILKLKVSDVKGNTHITLKEDKTNKIKRIKIQEDVYTEVEKYIGGMADDDFLFKSQKGDNQPIGRVQAYRILNKAATAIGINGEIGTHTLRKTFGYHFYQRTKDVALLQDLFNHSSPSVTLRYIGINQDMMDKAIDDLELLSSPILGG